MVWSQAYGRRPFSRASWRARGIGLTLAAVIAGVALAGCGVAAEFADGRSKQSEGSTAVSPPEQGRSSGGAAAPAAPATADRSLASPGAPGDVPLPTADEGRQIIRNGTADLEVKSVADAFETVRQIAVAANGTVADSSFTGSADKQSAQLTLRVPVDRFGDVLARLREVAIEVRSITTGSTDVTDQYTDIEATIRNLRAVEAQYVTLLGRSGTIAEVLQVQDRLNQVRLQIDRTEARRQSLASRAEMSTITVSLRPATAGVSGSGPLARVQEAWAASLATLAAVGTAVLVTLVYLWWLIPLVVVAVLVGRRVSRRPHAVAAAEPPATSA